MAAARDDFLKELNSTTLADCSYPETQQNAPISIVA
jgi:hypothetical protein